MKCPVCGKNSRMELDPIRNVLVYKCLNAECSQEVTKHNRNIRLEVTRMRLKKILESTDRNILISNIRKLRIDVGLNQVEISKALGVSAQRYGTIERCDNIPTISKLMDIAYIYDIGLEELYNVVTVSSEQYKRLNKLIAKGDISTLSTEEEIIKKIILEEDPEIEKLEKAIKEYEEKMKITERKIFATEKKKDSEDIVSIKKTLKKMDSDLVNYRKKKNAILNQGTMIDYYNWQVAKKIIGYEEDEEY